MARSIPSKSGSGGGEKAYWRGLVNRFFNLLYLGPFCAAIVVCVTTSATAQFAGPTIQLPTFRVTEFRSVVSVPDGGSINLGGSLRDDLRIGRTPNSRSFSRSTARSNAQVSADILIMDELEQEMLSASAPALRSSAAASQAINGSPQVQAKADFISRNVDRFKTRR